MLYVKCFVRILYIYIYIHTHTHTLICNFNFSCHHWMSVLPLEYLLILFLFCIVIFNVVLQNPMNLYNIFSLKVLNSEH
jgi:hypothetical protein